MKASTMPSTIAAVVEASDSVPSSLSFTLFTSMSTCASFTILSRLGTPIEAIFTAVSVSLRLSVTWLTSAIFTVLLL